MKREFQYSVPRSDEKMAMVASEAATAVGALSIVDRELTYVDRCSLQDIRGFFASLRMTVYSWSPRSDGRAFPL